MSGNGDSIVESPTANTPAKNPERATSSVTDTEAAACSADSDRTPVTPPPVVADADTRVAARVDPSRSRYLAAIAFLL